MRKSLILFLMSGLALLLLAAPQSRGDGVDTFNLTEDFSGLVYVLTWQSPAAPDTTGNSIPDQDFILSGVPVDVSLDGTYLYTQSVDFIFYNTISGSGDLLDAIGLFGLGGIGQLYSGSESSPIFLAGTYTGTDSSSGGTATLVISTPEPSSLLLFSAALLVIGGLVFLRKFQL